MYAGVELTKVTQSPIAAINGMGTPVIFVSIKKYANKQISLFHIK